MFTIRRIFDAVLPVNRTALAEVQRIMLEQFRGVRAEEITGLGDRLVDPFLQRFRTMLLVAEGARRSVLGFAVVLQEPTLKFCYLDYIATGQATTRGGVGGALYERVRDEAVVLGAQAIFLECLPDDPREVASAEELKQNRARLRFYERYGARPLTDNDYQRPIQEGDKGLPLLVYDGLGAVDGPGADWTRKVVRAVLERKYYYLCPPEYISAVVRSFSTNPVPLRPPRYVKPLLIKPFVVRKQRFPLIVNDRHDIHHVHDRGYVEAPVRIARIASEIERTGLFRQIAPKEHGEKHILAVHDMDFVKYLKRVCAALPPGKSVYPYVFPVRNQTRPPRDLSVRAGYYCIDTFTPLNENAFKAAQRAVDCALTGALALLDGDRLAYALVRPPGHHAERRTFGGFCYFNNAAIAAQFLCAHGKVAILDVDYHHGNGQQDIFYKRKDVLTVSIHGHPDFAYPYFSGFEEEQGEGEGASYNLNIPLPEKVDGQRHRKALTRALGVIRDFGPQFIVLCFGIDTAKADPTGTWTLQAMDFAAMGRLIADLERPTLVVQEGGYRTRTLGVSARAFFEGFFNIGPAVIPARKRID
jgi:acetoin utilization deacetylase AcuC-like enzyme